MRSELDLQPNLAKTYKRRILQVNLPHEHGRKSPQQSLSKLNLTEGES